MSHYSRSWTLLDDFDIIREEVDTEGMCFDCKLPFSTLSLIIVADYDLTFSSQQRVCVCMFHISLELLCWKDVTYSMKWPKEHVYAITCRLIIFFYFFFLHLREAIESHTCYPLITFSSEIEDIEFQFFSSLTHSRSFWHVRLSNDQITRLI